MEATVTSSVIAEEHVETQRGRMEPRARDEALRMLFDELEGRARTGFMYFRGVKGDDGKLADFRCVYLNRSAQRILGGCEVRGELLSSLERQDGLELFDRFAEAVRGGEATEGRIHGLVGDQERWYRGGVTPFRDGVTVRFDLVDLTERVRAEEAILQRDHSEEALRDSEERFRVTFNQVAVGLALVSREGKCLRANQRLCDLLGYSDAELAKLSFQELSHPEELHESEIRLGAVLAGERRSDAVERRLRRKDGVFVWARITLSAARKPEGGPAWAIAVVEDIQEHKRLEAEAKRATEFEHQLYGMMGHDLRSPLAALKATVAALVARPDGMSEPQRRALARISRSTNRIHRLVQELLDYTRMRLGDGVPVQLRRADARDICELVAEEFEHAHPGRVTLCDTGGDARVHWDPDRVKQLLENLVENAVTYGAQDRPVWILLGGDDERVILQVHNDGAPIPPERLPHLFEPFNYGPQVEQTVKLSLGLGLYLVREVARAHGGAVSVRSTLDEGTTFAVTLPRRPVSSLEVAAG